MKKVLNMWNKFNQKTAMLLFPLFVLLVTQPASAAAGNKYDATASTAFEGVYNWLAGFLTGNGGKVLAAVGLIVGLSTVATGHYKIMIAAFVVMVGCLVGPVFIDDTFATIW